VNVVCPNDQQDTPAPVPAVESDPNNDESCPATQPDWSGPRQACDASVLTTDCLYDKYECDGFEEYAGYITRCSCQEEGDGGVLYCAQALVQCPDVDAPQSCPLDMPREGDSCAFATGQPCQYNPYNCPDSLDIHFADVCECSPDATFVCSPVGTSTADSRLIEGVHPNCHNDIVDPQCPILSPGSQNEACSIDSSILCGYDPVSCPGQDDPAPIFLTTCQCLENSIFECVSPPSGLDCDGDGTTDTGGGTPTFDICFPGDALVEVQGESFVPMNQLQIGDFVRVDAKGTYEPIYSFGHLHPTRKAEFIEFRTTTNMKPLRMTAKHLIYEQRQGLFIPASNVKVGDILVSSAGDEGVTVTSIRKVQASGLYAPFTPSGTIMVNNVLVSSFIDLQLSTSISTTSMQWLAHMGEFPHRVMCYYSGFDCQGETYNEVGINEIYIQPLKFIREYLSSSSSSTVSTVFMTFLIPILFTFFYFMEQFLLLLSSYISMTMMGLLLLVVLRVGSSSSSWVLRMKNNKKHVE